MVFRPGPISRRRQSLLPGGVNKDRMSTRATESARKIESRNTIRQLYVIAAIVMPPSRKTMMSRLGLTG